MSIAINAGTSFEFDGLWGNWGLTALLGVLLLAGFIAGLCLHLRTRGTTDALAIDWVRRGLVVLVTLAALARPTIVVRSKSTAVNAVDVFYAVDVTGSMAVADAADGPEGTASDTVTRLSAARQAIDALTTTYAGARFAGVSFGASSSLDVPPTSDQEAIRGWAHDLLIEPTSVSSGSSLDEPLDTLIRAMQDVRRARPNDAIVLYFLSDGEKTSERERRTYTALRQYVDGGAVLALGSRKGGKVPLVTPVNSAQISASTGPRSPNGWVSDPSTKQPAVSRMDPATLKAIADEVSIPYQTLDARHSARNLPRHASRTYALERSEIRRTRREALVWPFALAIAALLVWELVVDIVRMRRHL